MDSDFFEYDALKLYSYDCNTKSPTEIADLTTKLGTKSDRLVEWLFDNKILLSEMCFGWCDWASWSPMAIVDMSTNDISYISFRKIDWLQWYNEFISNYVTYLQQTTTQYKNQWNSPEDAYMSIHPSKLNSLSAKDIENFIGFHFWWIEDLKNDGSAVLVFNYGFNILDSKWSATYITLPARVNINIANKTINLSTLQYWYLSTNALNWISQKWLTKYNTIQGFRPSDSFTREQAAKFFGQFAINVMQKKPDSNMLCDFSDINLADETLKNDIITACQLGIFKWYKGKFDPKAILQAWEAAAVLIRIIDWYQDETMQPWFTKYNLKILSFWFDIPWYNQWWNISRWVIWQMLYMAQ